jgi:hypothetical protein
MGCCKVLLLLSQQDLVATDGREGPRKFLKGPIDFMNAMAANYNLRALLRRRLAR